MPKTLSPGESAFPAGIVQPTLAALAVPPVLAIVQIVIGTKSLQLLESSLIVAYIPGTTVGFPIGDAT
jgi:hypothetical protein